MDNLFTFGGLILALMVLASIAFPHLLLPDTTKKRRVGSSYWGVYEGAPTDEPESEKLIECKQPIRKEKVIGGSAMYSKGRGTSFSQ